MNTSRAPILIPFFFLLPACSSTSDLTAARDYLIGSYDSSTQATADPEYRTIVLHMAPCWTARSDGPWLYVEQAMAEKPEAPYRQRVYHLVALKDQRIRSDVFELPGSPEEVVKKYTGEWNKSMPLAGLSPDALTERIGCSIFLERQRGSASFFGSTMPSSCPSTLRGATYATSEVVLTPDVLRSWDRGFDKEGNQVWGATKGAYIFVKQPPVADPI